MEPGSYLYRNRFLKVKNTSPLVFKWEPGSYLYRNRFLSVKSPSLPILTLGTRFLPTGNRFPRPVTAFLLLFDSILHPLSFPNFPIRIGTLETPFYHHYNNKHSSLIISINYLTYYDPISNTDTK